jgi:hypothetical protein
MRLIALEIPDEPAELAHWLERSLVGPDLASLVAELEAIHGEPAGAQPSARGMIGRDLDLVYSEGLATLPRTTLKHLLRQPRLLLELQEMVLENGGRHWDRLVLEGAIEADRQIERGRKRLRKAIAGRAKPNDSDLIPLRPLLAWYRQPLFVSLATAASVLVAVFVFERNQPPVDPAWGWNKPGALSSNLPPGPYLVRLAEEAEDWFAQRPDNRMGLARRISEFRQSCTTLILANHKSLNAEDRAWLVGKCKEWASKLDAQIVELEAQGDTAKVRGEADETVRKLINALRDRASRPA